MPDRLIAAYGNSPKKQPVVIEVVLRGAALSATEGTTAKRPEEQAKTLAGPTNPDGSKHDQLDELLKTSLLGARVN